MHALARATALSATHVSVRLDKKNAVRGCIHLTELAEPGQVTHP